MKVFLISRRLLTSEIDFINLVSWKKLLILKTYTPTMLITLIECLQNQVSGMWILVLTVFTT